MGGSGNVRFNHSASVLFEGFEITAPHPHSMPVGAVSLKS